MRTLEQVAARLQYMNLKAVSEATGVAYHTIRRIVQGATNVDYEPVKKLSDWLDEQDKQAG